MMRNANGKVQVRLPRGMSVSHVSVPGETLVLEHDNGTSTVTDAIPVVDGAIWVSPASALEILDSPTSPFRQANAALLAALQAKAQAEGYTPRNRTEGTRVTDMLQAAEDGRPLSRAEEIRRLAAARGADVHATLRALGRIP